METGDRNRLIHLLTDRPAALPRPARRFLEMLAHDPVLQGTMYLCRPEERAQVRHSVWISTEIGCWSVLLDNDPEGGARAARSRARLALEGLDLTPSEVAERLRAVPIWFLALDPDVASPPPGEAARQDRTVRRLTGLDGRQLRRRVLLDQVDAALEAGDLAQVERLRQLLA